MVHDPEQLQFYDFWVARDANGAPLSNVKPFVHHTYSLQRLDRGLPFPVSCCWNGMLSMNAEPFTHHSLRFRSGPSDGPLLRLLTRANCLELLRGADLYLGRHRQMRGWACKSLAPGVLHCMHAEVCARAGA